MLGTNVSWLTDTRMALLIQHLFHNIFVHRRLLSPGISGALPMFYPQFAVGIAVNIHLSRLLRSYALNRLCEPRYSGSQVSDCEIVGLEETALSQSEIKSS